MKSASSALMGAILLGCQGTAVGASSVEAVRPMATGLHQVIGEPSTPILRTIQSAADASNIPDPPRPRQQLRVRCLPGHRDIVVVSLDRCVLYLGATFSSSINRRVSSALGFDHGARMR